MSMMHPLPQGRSPRYYQVRAFVRGLFWGGFFIGAITLINIVTGIKY